MSPGILNYIVRRILQAIPLILFVIVLNFTIIHLAPGDPIIYLIGETATPELIEEKRRALGLDKPMTTQLWVYIKNVFQGDLGYSLLKQQSVTDLISQTALATIILMVAGLSLAVIFGLILGIASARKPYSIRDNVVTSFSLIGYSVPTFWLGQLLLLFFAIQLDLFPSGGMESLREELTGFARMRNILIHLVLPALTLSGYHLAIVTRLTRANMLEVIMEDYITMARSKGLDERKVYYKHALRNALLPVVTYTGMSIGLLISGAVMTETVFSWPGMGRLMFSSLLYRDYPTLMGIFVLLSISVILVNLITDIIYTFLDPRIAYE